MKIGTPLLSMGPGKRVLRILQEGSALGGGGGVYERVPYMLIFQIATSSGEARI